MIQEKSLTRQEGKGCKPRTVKSYEETSPVEGFCSFSLRLVCGKFLEMRYGVCVMTSSCLKVSFYIQVIPLPGRETGQVLQSKRPARHAMTGYPLIKCREYFYSLLCVSSPPRTKKMKYTSVADIKPRKSRLKKRRHVWFHASSSREMVIGPMK